MPACKPFYLNVCTKCCSTLAIIAAGFHYSLFVTGFLKTSSWLLNAPGGVYRNLVYIWNARVVRRMVSVLVRSPLRKSTLKMVTFPVELPVNSGCIIVICHTPWKRILVQWCLENKFGLILAFDNWTRKRKLFQRKGNGFREMRELVKYLQQSGRIIVTADAFNNLHNCPVNFLGSGRNASLLPARLAALTGVPLVVAIPELNNGMITFKPGPKVYNTRSKRDACAVIQKLVAYIEKEITNNPSIWPMYVN